MTDEEEFRREHGEEWTKITRSPSFGAAMTVVGIAKFNEISGLTNDEIEVHGKVVLADLRGHLKHESALFALIDDVKPLIDDLGPPTYPDPEEEIEQAEQIGKQRQEEEAAKMSPPIRRPQKRRKRRK